MTGGEYTDKVTSGEIRTWSAPNLTDVPNGLASWPVEEVAAYLKTGRNSFNETHGPMNEVILNSTRHLNEADVNAMAMYLKSLPGNKGDIGKPAQRAGAARTARRSTTSTAARVISPTAWARRTAMPAPSWSAIRWCRRAIPPR